MSIQRVLIANRGEIALRVIRTIRDLGLESVAVYSDQDREAPFVKLATEAYALNGESFNDTYMNPQKILDICKRAGVDAVHPGYGFLSENADFVRAVEGIGVKWLGPSGEAIDRLGDKVKARLVAEAAGVSPVPGISESLHSADTVRSFIDDHGYPVILKRADGGGGHGITVVRSDSDLENFLVAHTHDLEFYFIERFVENARHVETQCARDNHGNFAVVSTRDCSVQRRNQKLVEEAPAPFVHFDILDKMFTWSKSLFETVEYTGLGTCEYLLETKANGEQALYFLEVNPRLQVEHTVSEEVSGLDLVEEQIKIANGEELTQKGNLSVDRNSGHSFELRITSEDPIQNMTPTGGVVSLIQWPVGQGIRLEPGILQGDLVTTDFDSMVAKIIITGANRTHAIARVRRALDEFELKGIATPKELFRVIFDENDFISETADEFKVSTKWLENKILPAFIENNGSSENAVDSSTGGADSTTNSVEENPTAKDEYKEFTVELDGKRTSLKLPESLLSSFSSGVAGGSGGQQFAPRISGASSRGGSNLLRRGGAGANADSAQTANADPSQIASPMQGIVVRVTVEIGQTVAKGDLIVVLEAMKMEKFVVAEADGVVESIEVNAGDSVSANQLLVKLEGDGKVEGKV